ncbi:hypothetical protein [Pseudomonas indica]|uniref:hypothetical protein n=1 Tax=Pseudomonas indica TaxID=137658 RepID=UPI0023F73B09|nr:hypothetical protein [Pseudomonas indica]MBU3056884.1 hypothetical protein [Pseudomonas indica]
MIVIAINEERQNLSEINPDWIHRQIKGRENDGIPVCVTISVNEPGIDLMLSCGECGSSSGGGSRKPNVEEQRVFSLWDKFDCGKKPINTGQLVAFLKRLEDI